MRPFLASSAAFLAVACSHHPPPSFTPDPSLVDEIRSIQIIPTETRACPGTRASVTYEAILADGSHVPFVRSYDPKQPPRLHVVLLDRHSPEAWPRDDGDWDTKRDPLATLTTGFRLTAALKAKPSITTTVVVPPSYACLGRRFAFSGVSGGINGMSGSDGPDILVRLALARSPFYDRLVVAAIAVRGAEHFVVVGDAMAVPAAGWLILESEGGDGARGSSGLNGTDGVPGAPGCPGGPGGSGQDGSDGGPGGRGGDGGSVRVVVPDDQSALARLIDARSVGGSGGSGGSGGRGGRGGIGGAGLFDVNNLPCGSGADGMSGRDGISGSPGGSGTSGRSPIVVTASAQEILKALPRLDSLLQR